MKKQTIVLFVLAAALLTVGLSGCAFFGGGVSVDERMAMFQDDVNAKAWGNLKGHTHPDAGMYNLANDAYWENVFIGGSFTYSTSGDDATVTGTGYSYTFHLEIDEQSFIGTNKEYKVRSIVRNADGVVVFN